MNVWKDIVWLVVSALYAAVAIKILFFFPSQPKESFGRLFADYCIDEKQWIYSRNADGVEECRPDVRRALQ